MVTEDCNGQARPQTEMIRDEGFICLSRAAMHEVGPAAQTLGGLYEICGGRPGSSTFVSQERIATAAGLPARTIRMHLPKLVATGWIACHGREPLGNRGRTRRTCTYTLTTKAIDQKAPYAVLPRWAAEHLPKWSERAVYALLASLWLLIEKVAEEGTGCADDRISLSLTAAQKMTGLSRPAVCQAFHGLTERGIMWRDLETSEVWLEDFDAPLPASKKRGGIDSKPKSKSRSKRYQSVEKKAAAIVVKNVAVPSKNPAGTPVKNVAVPSKKDGGTPVKKMASSLCLNPLCLNTLCLKPSCLKPLCLNPDGKTSSEDDAVCVEAFEEKTSMEGRRPNHQGMNGTASNGHNAPGEPLVAVSRGKPPQAPPMPATPLVGSLASAKSDDRRPRKSEEEQRMENKRLLAAMMEIESKSSCAR